MASPGIDISPSDGQTEVRPDSLFLEIGTGGWGASVDGVQLYESRIAADGTRSSGRLIEGKLVDGNFVLADGSNPLQPDAEYTVTVRGTVKALSISGLKDSAAEKTISFTTISTPMPVVSTDGIKVRYGEQIRIEWNIPIEHFEYKLDGVGSTMTLDEDGTTATIAVQKFEQGKEYPLEITSATSRNGMELKTPVVSTVKTAAPLQLVFDPADGTPSASTDAKPVITFSEPVSNPDRAQSIVSMEPKVDGTWNWISADKLQFAPKAPWEHTQNVTVMLKGGPDNLRAASGGFIEADIQSTFTTAPNKAIDVDISDQVLTMLEDGKPVETFLCSTGTSAFSTPLGDYTIYAKIPKTDMRGPGYFAPAVPWVLVFKGDYTIHGNYWATAFGRPSSHGCVGLPVDTAKHVYDWTDIGTPVHIHD